VNTPPHAPPSPSLLPVLLSVVRRRHPHHPSADLGSSTSILVKGRRRPAGDASRHRLVSSSSSSSTAAATPSFPLLLRPSGTELAVGQSRPSSSHSQRESTANGRMKEGVRVLLEDRLFWVLIPFSLFSSLAQKSYLTMGLGALVVDSLSLSPPLHLSPLLRTG
jgi:hypothetical protein